MIGAVRLPAAAGNAVACKPDDQRVDRDGCTAPRGGCGAAAGAGVARAEPTSGLKFSEVEDDDDMLEGVL